MNFNCCSVNFLHFVTLKFFFLLHISRHSEMASPAWGGLSKINALDKIPRPFLIGVAGGTASGKVQEKDIQKIFSYD